MLKPFLHQIDYIGGCLFYTGIATVLFILILTVSDKTKLDFSEKLAAGSDAAEIVVNNGITLTSLSNCESGFKRLNKVQKNHYTDACDIAGGLIGNSESRYSEALTYMKGYFPTESVSPMYFKSILRFISRRQAHTNLDTYGIDSQKFVSETISEYISKRDPALATDLAIHAGNALMEFAV